MRFNTIVTLGASAAFGVVAIVLARGWVNDAVQTQYTQGQQQNMRSDAQQISGATPRQNLVPVLVADIDLNFGDTVTPQSLRIAELPESALPAGHYTDFDSLFSDPKLPTVALTKMVAGETVLDFKISGPGGRGSLSALIGEDMRAVAIRVNDVAGVGGFIAPGDTVDVMLTREIGEGSKNPEQETVLIAQNLKVLGRDQNADQQSAEPNVAQTVTLEVTNEAAQKLILGMSVGKLSLTLRRTGEMALVPNMKISMKDLDTAASGIKRKTSRSTAPRRVSQALAVRPLSPGHANVTVIRGDQPSKVSVFIDETPKLEPLYTPERSSDRSSQLAGG